MASKGKVSVMRVAVCGLTSSSYNGLGGQGAGKSCLCNRFIQPTHDKLHSDHTSVLNLSEFGSNVINNTHFLYWGEKITALEDGQEIKFQIVEHTEFMDDSSLKPFSTTKPYHKRCLQIKLQSGGKVTYIEPNQLALPEYYTDAPKFPDKYSVDGFILCVDVTAKFDHPSDPQKNFFDQLLHNLLSTKKPVVVACTKFDRARQASVTSVSEIAARSKKPVPMVEVSALKGVNVDTCFLVLAHMIDSRKPRTKIISYAESKAMLDERTRKNEEALQTVLDERLLDFSMSLEEARKSLRAVVEYQILVDLSGQDRVNKLIQAKLKYLKLQLVKTKTSQFVEMLPHVLSAMLPVLQLHATKMSAKSQLRSSSKFSRYFIMVENWKEDDDFLKSSSEDILVPFDFLDSEQGQEILETHMNEVLAELRSKAAAEKIKQVLNSTTDILPGVDMTMLWVDLGLAEQVKRVSDEQQLHIYNEYMGKLEQECVADLTELFLERSDLFDQISASPNDTFFRVHQELKDVPRYKRLDHRSQLRMSQALKHIGSLQMPGKSHVYGKSGLQDAMDSLQATLSRERLKPGAMEGEGPCWEFVSEGGVINLSILARTEENARTLRSDFMNHFSGSGTVQVDDKTYQIEMKLQHGHHIHSLRTKDFVPNGAVAVVTSTQCVDWLKDLVHHLWVFKVGERAPYRGMPLIILALDKDWMAPKAGSKAPSSSIHAGAQAVAAEVQCVCITETPTPQPMRLVVSSVIHQILLSFLNAISHLDTFFGSALQTRDPAGFNIAVYTLVGDPYPNEALLHSFLHQQLVCSMDKGDHSLLVKCAIEQQHRTCVFTFNSMFNVPSSIHLGFILVYSTQRLASFSVLKYLLPKLPNIPKLIVAMTMSQSHDNELLEKGKELAKEWEAMFVTNNRQELSAGFAVEFLHKCWFRRFSSWQTQNFSDDVRLQLRGGRKQARALPNRPTFDPSTSSLPSLPAPTGSLTPNRHSMGTILDHVDHSDSIMASNTLPRSPVKPSFRGALSSSFEEGDIYSNPVEQMLGKKATLERKKKTSIPVSPPFMPPKNVVGGSIDLDQVHGLSDYASVEDAVKHTEMSAGMVHSLRKQPRRSPSMSPPPPPPMSPPDHTPILEEGEGQGVEPSDMYAIVDTSHKKSTSPTGGKGYDHLQPDDSPPTKGYDHLNPPPPTRPPRTDLASKTSSSKYAPIVGVASGRDPSPSDVYDTLEDEGPMYATIDVCKTKKKKPPEPPTSKIPDRTSSPTPMPRRPSPLAVRRLDKPDKRQSNSHHMRMKSADLTLTHTVAQPDLDQMYSTVQKPRPREKPRRAVTPEEHMYSVPEKKKKKPPPLAPKPTSRPSTPEGAPRGDGGVVLLKRKQDRFTHIRSESLDAGLLLSASSSAPMLQQDSRRDIRSFRSHSFNQEQKLLQRSPLRDQRSPSPEIKTFSSLPSSYRNRARIRETDIQRTKSKSKEELSHHKTREPSPRGSHDLIRVREIPRWQIRDDDEIRDVEWEEDAPPLPPRNYSWSDIEDNDEDVLQSDDDLDDVEPINEVSIMEHQKLYASIRRLSIHTPNSIEEIYNVVNRYVPPSPDTRKSDLSLSSLASRSQWLPQVVEQEEQTYDSLENVVKSIQKPPATYATPTRTADVSTSTTSLSSASSVTSSLAESLPLTPRDIKLIKQQQKLLQKLQKKLERETEQRRRQEEKKRKREEEQRKKDSRKRGKKGKPKPPESTRYFGSPIVSVVENDGVPLFVRKCVDMLEGRGMTTVGLYRVSGKKEDCLTLQDKYDLDPSLDITTLGFFESCISSTLKAFFKLLPEPLVSNEIATQLLVINSLDADSQRTRIHEILNTMPRPNLCTFRFLMKHLHNVQVHQDVNKMNASNLAIVFWPTLIRPPLMDLADSSKQMGWQLIMTRIIEHPDFVPDIAGDS